MRENQPSLHEKSALLESISFVGVKCFQALFLLSIWVTFCYQLMDYFSVFLKYSLLNNIWHWGLSNTNVYNVSWVIKNPIYHLKNITTLLLMFYALTFDIVYPVIKHKFIQKYQLRNFKELCELMARVFLYCQTERILLLLGSIGISVYLFAWSMFIKASEKPHQNMVGFQFDWFFEPGAAIGAFLAFIIIPSLFLINICFVRVIPSLLDPVIINTSQFQRRVDIVNRFTAWGVIFCIIIELIVQTLVFAAFNNFANDGDIAIIVFFVVNWDFWCICCDILGCHGIEQKQIRLYLLGFFIGVISIIVMISVAWNLCCTNYHTSDDINAESIILAVCTGCYALSNLILSLLYVKYNFDYTIIKEQLQKDDHDDKWAIDYDDTDNQSEQSVHLDQHTNMSESKCYYMSSMTFNILCFRLWNKITCIKNLTRKRCCTNTIRPFFSRFFNRCCAHCCDCCCCDCCLWFIKRCLLSHCVNKLFCKCMLQQEKEKQEQEEVELQIQNTMRAHMPPNGKKTTRDKKFNPACQSRFIQCVAVIFILSCVVLQFFDIVALYFGLRALLVVSDVLLSEDIQRLTQLTKKVTI